MVTFPGSLDDRDAARAVRIAGGEAVPLWHADPSLHDVDAVILPGGFSYGDYLRCGAIARFAPVMQTIVSAAHDGLPVLGICNGFQVLCEAHLLPGALIRNVHRRFVCRDQPLRVENNHTVWTSAYRELQDIVIPLKNGEGGYVADRRILAELEDNGRVVVRYLGNPNGSYHDIAGISNKAGNVVGLMPHPEHAVEPLTGPGTDGLGMFASLLGPSAGRRRMIDTVERAAETSEQPQPYGELGLAEDEYARIREILGRRPTSSELAIYSVMWSEHCSYKSSKVHLRAVRREGPQDRRVARRHGRERGRRRCRRRLGGHVQDRVAQPSVLRRAAPGRGHRGRGHRARHPDDGRAADRRLDSLRFGPLHAPDTARVLPGVVAGIGGYGNCLGLPNVGGEVYFDECYVGNPLVNALCVGVLRADGVKLAKADGPGNHVVLFGARTGGDGIGGASVLASATFDEAHQAKRPSVQVGDPFAEKVLIECCLEIFAADLVVGIQDLGAAGLSCATTELAAAGAGGMDVGLDRVPLRDPTLTPEEILMSESQERMMAVVTPAHLEEFLAVCVKWDVTATVIGSVTDTGRLRMWWHDAANRRPAAAQRCARGARLPAADRAPARSARDSACRRTRSAPPAAPGQDARHAAALGRIAQPGRQVLGHRPVRPLRHGQHRARPAGGRRRPPAGRVHATRRRDRHRRQWALHPPRSLRRRPVGAVRGLPQRGDDRSASHWPSRTA